MSAALATYLVGSACYGLSTVLGIRLRGGIEVSPAAALAPAVAVAAAQLDPAAGIWWPLAAPMSALAVQLLARRPIFEMGLHLALLRLCMVLAAEGMAGVESTAGIILALTMAGTMVYSLGWALGQRAGQRTEMSHGGGVREDLRMWLTGQGVLLSACGLVVLVVNEIGWPAFAAVVVALLVTRREFAAYSQAEKAYKQTVDVLSTLGEERPAC